MERNAIGLGVLLTILKGRFWIILLVTLLTLGVTLALSLRTPLKYNSTATLIIEFDQPVDPLPGSPLAASLQPNYMFTRLGIIKSRHVAGKVVDQLDLESDQKWQDAYLAATGGVGTSRDWIARNLLRALKVSPGENSRLVNITYTARDPELAAAVANAFAAAYETTNLEMSTHPAQREALQYQKWLGELRETVAQAQQNLSAYQQEKGILLVDERLDVETTRLKELVTQRILSEAEAGAVEARHRRVGELRAEGESLETLSEVLTNNAFRELKGQIGLKEAELAEGSRQYGINHPRYKQLSAELAVLRDQLNHEVESIAASLGNEVMQAQSRVQAFQEAEETQKARILELKQRRDEMPALVRELESAQVNYDQALATYNTFQVRSRASQTNVTLLNPALIPLEPSSPIVDRNLFLATILGLLLGTAIAVLVELRDRRIRSANELQEVVDLTYLGGLPASK